LFGNEVDSIRIFDPETQLSERKLLQVNIIPNLDFRQEGVETPYDTGGKVSLMEFLPENLVVWMQEWEFIKDKIEQQEEEFKDWSLTMEVNKEHEETEDIFVKKRSE
jgi:transcription-repair coupling factor (superfamily II helicase)